MKSRILLAAIIIALTGLSSMGQNVDEALRYSQQFYTGTARFSAMGGAFTALGGDLSSMVLNPAGTAVFRKSEFSFTPYIGNNKAYTYFTSEEEDFRYTFNIGQFGLVLPVIQTGSQSGLVSVNFGYSYNMTNDFNANIAIRGVSSTSSMADYWASVSNGIYYTNLNGAAGMAYDAWLMDTITGSAGIEYATVFSRYGEETNSTYGQTIRRVITNEGFNGEHSFSIGANISNNIFAGATLGLSRFNYTGHYEHLETDPENSVFDFNSFSYIDHYESNGTGFNLKAGLIFLPVEFVRLGVAVHTPTIYRISEYYYEDLTSSFDNGDRYEFQTDAFRFDYRMTTPFKVLAGAAVQIGKSATVSFDYEMLDYSMTRFSDASDGNDYYDLNNAVRDVFDRAHNIRGGAEYRIGALYLRGGYGRYGTAFSENEANNDTFHQTLSGGVGLRQAGFYFDLGFTKLTSTSKYFMYNYYNIDPVTIETTRNTLTATLGLRF